MGEGGGTELMTCTNIIWNVLRDRVGLCWVCVHDCVYKEVCIETRPERPEGLPNISSWASLSALFAFQPRGAGPQA